MKPTKIQYDEMLLIVVDGIKRGDPIYKILKKYGYNSTLFYAKTSKEMVRYFSELKCLKKSKRGKNCGCTRKASDTADFNEI